MGVFRDLGDGWRYARWRLRQSEAGIGTLLQDFVYGTKRDGSRRFKEPFVGGYTGEVPLERFGRFGMLIWIVVFPGAALVALFLIVRSIWHWMS